LGTISRFGLCADALRCLSDPKSFRCFFNVSGRGAGSCGGPAPVCPSDQTQSRSTLWGDHRSDLPRFAGSSNIMRPCHPKRLGDRRLDRSKGEFAPCRSHVSFRQLRTWGVEKLYWSNGGAPLRGRFDPPRRSSSRRASFGDEGQFNSSQLICEEKPSFSGGMRRF
jgi:hypothetical protein